MHNIFIVYKGHKMFDRKRYRVFFILTQIKSKHLLKRHLNGEKKINHSILYATVTKKYRDTMRYEVELGNALAPFRIRKFIRKILGSQRQLVFLKTLSHHHAKLLNLERSPW